MFATCNMLNTHIHSSATAYRYRGLKRTVFLLLVVVRRTGFYAYIPVITVQLVDLCNLYPFGTTIFLANDRKFARGGQFAQLTGRRI